MKTEDEIIKNLYISLIKDGIPREIVCAIIKNLINKEGERTSNDY